MKLLGYIEYKNENVIFKNKNIKGAYISWPTFNIEKIKRTPKYMKNKNTLVFIIPGLTGTPKGRYIQYLIKEALENGYSVVVYKNRLFEPENRLDG